MNLQQWIVLTAAGGDRVVLPPASHPLAWRGDFLTFQPEGRTYYLGDQDADAAMCQRYLDRGYTDVAVWTVSPDDDPNLEPYNFFESGASAYRTRAHGFTSRGLRVICGIGFEGADAAWERQRATWLNDLVEFVKGVDSSVSCYLVGLEVEEYWTWDEVLDTMAAIASVSAKPIAVHFGQTVWGPQNDPPDYAWDQGQQMSWWHEAIRRCPGHELACAFQHRHEHDRDQRANGGFLSPEHDFHDHIPALTDPSRLGGIGVRMISAEYAYGGSDLNAPSVGEAEAQHLGQLAFSLGAHGALNGC